MTSTSISISKSKSASEVLLLTNPLNANNLIEGGRSVFLGYEKEFLVSKSIFAVVCEAQRGYGLPEDILDEVGGEANSRSNQTTNWKLQVGDHSFDNASKETIMTADMLRNVNIITIHPLRLHLVGLGLNVERKGDGIALLSFDPTNLTISALKIYSKCLIGDGEWKIIEGDSIQRKDIYQRAQIIVKVDIPDDADSATL